MLAPARLRTSAPFQAPSDDVIAVRDLTKVYPGGIEAIKGIRFFVRDGEFFGFLGPNGAGKSTTIKILITLLARSSGEISVLGYDVSSEASTVRRLIGYAAPEACLDLELTGRENLSIQGSLYHLDRATTRRRSAELIELMDLGTAADRKVETYSGGMRKRVDLACALIHKPRVLFLDEPSSGLDPQNRAVVWRYLERLNKEEGLTIFLTTHYMEEADRLCDRLAIIDDGIISAEGSPADLKASIGGAVVSIVFKTSGGRSANEQARQAHELVKAFPFVSNTRLSHGDAASVLAAAVSNGGESIPILLRVLAEARLDVTDVRLTSPTLDDVFLKYTGVRGVQVEPIQSVVVHGS
ncbi:MAG: transporter ATP-binding protein [Chloroflexi bacterium]|nr:transporter ATP-binding protein [Chloroflexota bacterium]